MSRPLSQILRTPFFYALLALAAMLALSFNLRKNDFIENNGSQNLEASYHALLTVKSIDENPAINHLFLPTISLGGEENKQIPWGATVQTKTGDYIYTSFNFPMFVAPYLWFKTFNIEQNITNLARFNFLLGGATSIMLMMLCYGLLQLSGYSSVTSSLASISACTVSVFSRETLLSHGLTYWAQSLYQVILAATLIALYKFLSGEPGIKNRAAFYSVVFLAFIGALTEWTGYVLSVGLILLLWFGSAEKTEQRRLAVYVFIATSLSAIFTLLHFSAAIGFYPEIQALLLRFTKRSASAGSIAGLIQGYGLSYGLFLIFIIGISAIAGFTKTSDPEYKRSKTILLIFIASCIPLIENLVLLQHATEYTFDRLKFVFPAAIILAFCFARSKVTAQALMIAALIIASLQGYKSYKADLSNYSTWSHTDKNNKDLAGKVKASTKSECAVFASNVGVRGYANLLFNHGIYEYISPQDAEALLLRRNGCELVYLEANMPFADMPRYLKATIMKGGGSVEVISSEPQISIIDGR